MTVGEVERALQSKQRIERVKAQEKATFDYILADLVGRSVGRLYSSSTKVPEIYEVYPTIFDESQAKEQKEAKRAELSALRFKLFANAHNKKFENKGGNNLDE